MSWQVCWTLFSPFRLLPLTSLISINKPSTSLYKKTLNHNLPVPSLKNKTWKFLNGKKPLSQSLLPSSCLRGPHSISIKTCSFMISANRDSGGIQLANTQTFSLLEKTAAVIVNKIITDWRRLPPSHMFNFKHVNDLYSNCNWNDDLNQRM